MNRTKTFLLNSLTTAIYQICLLAYGFIIPKVMLTYYGSELNGLVSSINQFISYFNLAEAGLAGAAVYALYKPLANEDTGAINGVVSGARKLYTQAGVIFTALVMLLAVAYPILKPPSGLSPILVCILVLVLGVKGALEFFTLAKYRALLTADQRTYVISNTSSIYTVLSAICTVILASLRFNIVMVYLLALSAVFARSLLLLIYVRKHYKYLDFRVPPNTQALDKRWDAFYQQVLSSLQFGTSIVLATLFFSYAQVSVYSVYNLVLNGVGSLVGIFDTGLSALFGSIIVKKDTAVLKNAYNDFQLFYYALLSVIYSICFAAIMPFILIYTAGITDANYNVPTFGMLMVLSGFLYSLHRPQGMMVIAAGHYRETRKKYTVHAVLTVSLSAVFIPFFGLNGIVIGACLTSLYRAIDLAIYTPRNITDTPPLTALLRMLWSSLTCLGSTLICSMIPLEANNYLEWVGLAIVYGVISVTVTGLSAICFEWATVKSLWHRATGIFFRHG